MTEQSPAVGLHQREKGRSTVKSTKVRRPTAPDGLVLVDKPGGWTSHDVVARIRGLAGTRKVGHAGTLDPMATGVLVLGIGRATRLLTYVVGADKEYTATIRLGVSTTTDDAEGEICTVTDASSVARAAINAAVADLTGEIEQVPSSVSAIKVDGKRAYARVRSGEEVVLAARPVKVSTFEVLEVRTVADLTMPAIDLDVRVECSSGTYIRALARDLGAALGVGGHLTALRRTRVGGYHLADTQRFADLEAQVDADGTLATLALADAARATFPVRELTEAEAAALSFGQWLDASDTSVTTAAITPAGELAALVENVTRSGNIQAKPVVVFAPAGS